MPTKPRTPPAGVGDNIRAERTRLGWTRAELLKRMDYAISASTLVAIEAGRTSPRLSTLLRMSNVMGVNIDRLVAP